MNVTGVDFVTVPTRDIEEADRFYGDVLGLERSKQWGDRPAREYETGSLTLALMQSDAFGVEFRGDTIDSGVCHMAIFADPDGNSLMLHHRYAP